MKILLTGATGFLGYRTLEKLVHLESVDSIIAAGRTKKESHSVLHSKVTYMLGDLNDKEHVDNLVKNVDIIIHAAALSSPWGKEEEFRKANVISQQLLINSAKKNNVKRFIYISTPSLYYNGTDRFLVKESDPLPQKFVNWYAATKREAELLLEQSGLSYITLRPRALTGRGDTVIMPRLIRAFDEGRLKIIGSGKNMVDLTSVSNAADAILLSIKANEKALNHTYNISNGDPVDLWNSIEYVLDLMGKKMSKKKIAFPVVHFVAQLMELKSKLTNYKEPTLTKYGVGTLAKSITLDISKAKTLLNYQPEMSTKGAIEEFVNWYLNEKRS